MDTLKSILVVIHLLGFAALFGGLLIQAKEPVKKVNFLMRDGIGTAFVLGLILVGIDEGDNPGGEFHAKIAVKLVIALVILVLVMMNLRRESIPKGLWLGLLVLTVANVCVAAIWHVS